MCKVAPGCSSSCVHETCVSFCPVLLGWYCFSCGLLLLCMFYSHYYHYFSTSIIISSSSRRRRRIARSLVFVVVRVFCCLLGCFCLLCGCVFLVFWVVRVVWLLLIIFQLWNTRWVVCLGRVLLRYLPSLTYIPVSLNLSNGFPGL